MGIKDSLSKLKFLKNMDSEKAINIFSDLVNIEHSNESWDLYDLDKKVDDFIKYYYDNYIKNYSYSECVIRNSKNKMINFIEKMAVWYELRYPDYELDVLMGEKASKYINEIMFDRDLIKQENVKSHYSMHLVDWSKFYNASSFIKSLPNDEKRFLDKPKYPERVDFGTFHWNNHHFVLSLTVKLTRNGVIKEISPANFTELIEDKKTKVLGMNLSEFLDYLDHHQVGFVYDRRNSIRNKIYIYEKKKYLKEEILNCVMYRIIERGMSNYGAIRGYLFAKEFGRNKDIPIMYGAGEYNLKLYEMYLNDGGNVNLMCIDNYFYRDKDTDVSKISVYDYMKSLGYFTEEEKILIEKFVSLIEKRCNDMELIDNNVDYNKFSNDEVNQKRLERKLEKARKNRK